MTHLDLSDDAFELQFAETTLDPALFNHEAHLRLAWIHVKKYGVERAVEHICRQIRAFDGKFGDGTKYNATVTAGAIRAVNHFYQKSATATFTDFLQENPRLKHNLRELLTSHYSTDVFRDKEAKMYILEPDLEQF